MWGVIETRKGAAHRDPPLFGVVQSDSNRPTTNFQGFSVDSNRVDSLVEKDCLAYTIRKSYQTRLIPVFLGRRVVASECRSGRRSRCFGATHPEPFFTLYR